MLALVLLFGSALADTHMIAAETPSAPAAAENQPPNPPPPPDKQPKRLGDMPAPVLVSGGPDPSLHPPQPPHEDDSEPFFFSWEFINALFAIILIVEFVVFPVLFKMWFFSKSSEVNEN